MKAGRNDDVERRAFMIDDRSIASDLVDFWIESRRGEENVHSETCGGSNGEVSVTERMIAAVHDQGFAHAHLMAQDESGAASELAEILFDPPVLENVRSLTNLPREG